MTDLSSLTSGMVGYMIASIKTLDSAPVGDTIALCNNDRVVALPGFKKFNQEFILVFTLLIQTTIRNRKKP